MTPDEALKVVTIDSVAQTTGLSHAQVANILELLGDKPEWEYGRITKTQWAHPRMDEPSVTILANTEGNIEYQRNLGYMIVRRKKAGPWEPVE